MPALGPDSEQSDAVEELVSSVWETKGDGHFDGALMGVTGASVGEDDMTLLYRPIRYRDYMATDRVLGAHPDFPFPLAVGVHVVLSCREGIVCLRLKSGRIALPGGAVDAEDPTRAPGQALVHAASREVAEETGIHLQGHPVQVTGLYVGGYPTHILAMLCADLRTTDIEQTISTFRPSDSLDHVRSIELHPLRDLVGSMADLPLVLRAALRSFRHWRGDEPAWTIAT
jgi:8-oxo-dGTP pyrophosphatase MutT (NUDIX family)